MGLLTKILDDINIDKAYNKVVSNRGGAGIDGVTVDDLLVYMQENLRKIKADILNGQYKPQAVKGVEIPKSKGGTRVFITCFNFLNFCPSTSIIFKYIN